MTTTSPALTVRELQCLSRIAEGKTNRQIGAELGIAADTVKSHVERLLVKLGARNRVHAVAIGCRVGLLGGDV